MVLTVLLTLYVVRVPPHPFCRLAELNEKGVDVDMDRPISRGGMNGELDDGSSLSASISSYVRPKFKGEAEYTKEQQAERHKAVTKLQQVRNCEDEAPRGAKRRARGQKYPRSDEFRDLHL